MATKEHAIALALAAGLERVVVMDEADILNAAESALAFRAALTTMDRPQDEPWPPMRTALPKDGGDDGRT